MGANVAALRKPKALQNPPSIKNPTLSAPFTPRAKPVGLLSNFVLDPRSSPFPFFQPMFPRSSKSVLPLASLWALCALGLQAQAQQTQAPAPPAGTRILNQAETSYDYAGFTVRVQSNAVEIEVAPVESLDLTPNLFRSVTPGGFVSLPHRLTNSGNVAANYTLQVAPQSGNGFTLADLKVTRDTNSNGLLDAGEPELTPATPISLAAGESADLVVTGRVSPAARSGQIAKLDVSATSGAQGATARNTDILTLSQDVAVEVTKSATLAQATRGGLVNWQIQATSRGVTAPLPIPVTVDGAARSFIILRDELPANVTFEAFTGVANVNATPLYHHMGDAFQTYTTTAQTPVDGVAWGLTQLEGGATFRGAFSARVSSNAGGDLSNTAHFYYGNGGSLAYDLPSNQSTVSVPQLPPTLEYYTDNSFSRIAPVTELGRPLFLQGVASACNQDPTKAERVTLNLRSSLTGDSIDTIAVETGPNTGIFRVENPIPTSGGAANPSDGTLQTVRDDTLVARLGGCGIADAVTRILVDPMGVVFDARTNQPVAGARVSLVNANGTPAQVFDFDGVTPRPSNVTTGADGTFQFPQVAAGDYRLIIVAPSSYTFASKIKPANLPDGRNISATGSYGGLFAVSAQTGAVTIDVPLDPPARPGLMAEKTAATRDAEMGGVADYLVTVRNRTGVPLTGARVIDTLPVGFTYVSGSARRGATVVPDGTVSGNRQLTFQIGALKVDEEFPLRYRVRIGAGAREGKATNSAYVTGESPFENFTSNTATADVQVRGGVFTTRGILFGKVWIDANRDGEQGNGELAVPGARIFLEDGTYAVTDIQGKWSIYGLLPLTHVVKIDTTTLPAGAKLYAINTRYAGSGATAFADLKLGEMQKVNFALTNATPEVVSAVRARLAAGEPNAPELAARLQTALPAQVLAPTLGDVRAAPATGIIGGGVVVPGASVGVPGSTAIVPNGAVAPGGGKLAPQTGVTVPGGAVGVPGAGVFAPGGALGVPGAGLAPGSGTILSGSGVLVPGAGAALPGGAFGAPAGTLTVPLGDGAISGENGTILGADDVIAAPSAVVGADNVEGAPAGLDARPRRTAADGPQDGSFGPLESPRVPGGAAPLADSLAALDGTVSFLNLVDGDVLPSDQLNVRVGGNANARVQLFVNGQALPDSRVGTRSTDAKRGVTALEYIGVKLGRGANTLRVVQTDSFGVERGSVSISVIAPGNLGQIRLTVPNGAQADGKSLLNVGVELVDSKGVRVTARTPLTLEATAGVWKTADLNPGEPGVQVFLENGVGTFPLQTPFVPGAAAVRVSAGLITAKSDLNFSPFLRPVLAAGLVEGQFGFHAKGASRVSTDVFERQLSSFAGGNAGARGAGYVKGRIQGKYLLSMRFDTQNNETQRLFRDIQPDEFYPVYGDSSIKGFDAQSTGKLYVRVDKDNSFVLLGDFSTFGPGTDTISLGRYSRALNGVNGHVENEKFSASAFAARQSTTRIIQEIRGNGTGGPYRLNSNNLRPQSERVEIIVRDRNNPGLVLRATSQTRFSDYTLDGFTFGLVFRTPIPSFDADGNPVFVRVVYEVENGGPNHTVAGVSGTYKPTRNLQIGANLVRDDNPDSKLTMGGLNAAYRVSGDTLLIGEYSLTDTGNGAGLNGFGGGADGIGIGNAGFGGGTGNAYRFELRKSGKNIQAQAFTGRASADFNNPEAALTRGRSESGARLSLKAGAKTAINAEAIETKETSTGARTRGAQVGVDYAASNDLRLSAGVRHGEGDASATYGGAGRGNLNFTSAFARLNARIPGLPAANAFARYEQELSGANRSFAIGADYQISSRARIYATHEFFDSPLSLYALGDTQRRYGTRVGISSDYAPGQSLFSEYRIAGGVDGRSAQAAIGLRNRFRLGGGVDLNTTFERTRDLNGVGLGGGDGTAIALGLDSTRSQTFKWTARAEKRTGDNNDSTLFNAGAAYQATPSLTFLGRAAYASSEGVGGFASRQQTRLQIGGAYRPVGNDRFNALARYEFRNGDQPSSFVSGVDLGQRNRVNLFSGDLNYSLMRSLQARLHYALKNESGGDGFGAGTNQLISGRISRDLGRRLNASIIGARVFGGGNSQNSYGIELGAVVTNDLLFSVGYNSSRLRDRFFAEEIGNRGLYLRLRFKFDEDLFGGLKAFQVAPVPSTAKPFVPVTTAGGGVSFSGEKVAGLEGFTGTGNVSGGTIGTGSSVGNLGGR